MKMISKKLLLLIIFFGLSACQTPGVLIKESNLPVSEHRKAIAVAIGEPRLISQNGRELTSYYHDRTFKFLDVTPKTQRRYYTKVIILGARRPFEVSIAVHVEDRDPETGLFQDIGLDDGLSAARARSIQELLNQSRDRASTIDGSNPF